MRRWLGWSLALILTLFFIGQFPQYAFASQRAWLGVIVSNIDQDELEELELEYGVKVVRVLANSPADEAGIQKNDILVKLDDKPIYSAQRLVWLVNKYRPGDKVKLRIFRDGKMQTVKLQMGKKPSSRFPWSRRTYLGVQLQELTPSLREYFGAPEDQGVLIAEVEENSPADKAGLKSGDVILKMDRKTIHDIDDVYRVLDFFDPGEKITIEYLRNKKKHDVSVELGERPAPEWWEKLDHFRGRFEAVPPWFNNEEWQQWMREWREWWQEFRPYLRQLRPHKYYAPDEVST